MPDDPKSPDVMTLARQRYDAAVELRSFWDRLAKKDLQFKAGTNGETSYQWNQSIQSQRNSEDRPCFTINRIPSFLKQVVNQQRQAGPTIQIAPAGQDGDDDTAEVFQGMVRHIVTHSEDGEIAVDTAFEYAASAGLGWVLAVPRYVDDASDEQEIILDWVPDLFSCYWDMGAMKPDRRDMRYFFRVSSLPVEEYRQQWGTVEHGLVNSLPPHQQTRWFPKGTVVVADYYELVEEKTKDRRPGKKHVVWRTINGLTTLAETTIPIGRIPAVPCFGDQIFLDGKEDYRGMVRDGLDAQMAFNYWFTAITEQIALGGKAPYILDPRQIEGFESIWKAGNRKNWAYMPAMRWVELPNGQMVDMGFPERNAVEPPIQAMTVALNYADQALKQVMNLYEPSLGQRKSDQSGRAILALQQQGEIGNANYTDNLKRFLRSLGRLLVEMIPVYYDAPRVVRILGRDEKPQTVLVHAGGTAPDVLPPSVKKVYDLAVGRYDVTVTTGPSYVTKRQEQLSNVIDFLKVDPRAATVTGDIVAGLMELPEMQERLKRMLPPQFQDDGSPEASMAKLQAQYQILAQQHDLMAKELMAKTEYIKTDQAKYQAQIAIKQAEAALQLELQKMKDATTIAVAEITAETKGIIHADESKNKAIALIQAHAHEAVEAHLDREHEAAQTERQAQIAQSQAAQQQAHEADQNDADRAMADVQQQRDLDAQAEQAQNPTQGAPQ